MTISLSHTGNFQQGDSADNYTITVNNVGAGPTTGQVTVTDTLPTGLTPTAASGTGWTTSISGQTVTATRSDVLAAGASYPALTVTVSVASNAPASVTNTATVAGGGELNTTNDSASDPTTITPPLPDLVIAAHHSGNFRQGDSADNYAITVSNSGRRADRGAGDGDRHAPRGFDAHGGQRHGLDYQHFRSDGHGHSQRRAGQRQPAIRT